ncbi:MAG: hypothetical protein H0U59_10940 [Gemmatimonadaceae bacterium]|nr:hypothetical protein [Gemmatimonadaceae bacterium]
MAETHLAKRGPPAWGPIADSVTPTLQEEDVRALQDHLTINGGDFDVRIPIEEIVGLLRPFNGRARTVVSKLLTGYSVGMAAACAGVDPETVSTWGKRHPEFGLAVRKARDWGFRRTAERELQRRAMAGNDDKHSGRLLELWLKREDASYRDKSQLHMEVVHRALEAESTVSQGWKDVTQDAQTT